METFEAIKSRISVRKFSSKSVDKKLIFKIIEAASQAPSAGNTQIMQFILLDDREVIQKVGRATLQPEVFESVPYVVVVCANVGKMKREFPKQGEMFAVQSVAAAIENMLLAATDLGIDSLWMGAFADETVKSILRIPQDIDIHAIVPLGYRAEKPFRTNRMKVAHLVLFNAWGNKDLYAGGILPISKQIEKLKNKFKRKNK